MTHDEVGLPRRDPVDRARARAIPARERRSEMEVGEVPDPEPVERCRQAVDRHLDDAGAEPTCLEPAVRERDESRGQDNDEADEHAGTLDVRRDAITVGQWGRKRAKACDARRSWRASA